MRIRAKRSEQIIEKLGEEYISEIFVCVEMIDVLFRIFSISLLADKLYSYKYSCNLVLLIRVFLNKKNIGTRIFVFPDVLFLQVNIKMNNLFLLT